MNPRRLIVFLVGINALLVVLGLVTRAPQVTATEGKLRIGLVFDVGGKNDKSFNEAAWRGLERARAELGVRVSYIEPTEGSDRETALRMLAGQGLDLVIGVGFIFGPDLERLARLFPRVRFAGIDYAPSPGVGTIANLVGLRFREHEGSFVVGAIAGLLTRTKVVGFVGGMEIPLIRKFHAGYAAGVRHVCAKCTVLATYAGSEPKAFADPARGEELASAQYSKGADIIFHAAGKTGDGVFAAARKRRARVIGVDSDQFDHAPCCVVTSMVKRVEVAVFEVITELAAGQFHPGARELGLAEDGVGFISDERNRHLLPLEVAQQARALAQQIIDGDLVVPTE